MKYLIAVVPLSCVHCFQNSYAQLSISESQASDSTYASAGVTGAIVTAAATGSATSGGVSQTGGAHESTTLNVTSDAGTSMHAGETAESATGPTTQDDRTTGNSTSNMDPDETSAGTSTGQDAECTEDAKPLLLDGTCYGRKDVRLTFVTSEAFNGSMGDPDTLCAAAAMDAKLEGAPAFKAWATVKIGSSPVNRFDKDFNGPYVKFNPEDDPGDKSDDFILVAMGWTGLTTGNLISPINVTENMHTVGGYAWTAANADGSSNPFFPDCYNWSNSNTKNLPRFDNVLCQPPKSVYGTVGAVGETSPSWSRAIFPCAPNMFCCYGIVVSQSKIFECDSKNRLYCLQDKAK